MNSKMIRATGASVLVLIATMLGTLADAALVSYWPLDGNASATVGTHGVMSGFIQPAADRNEVPNGALSFNQHFGDYVEVPGGGGLDGAYVGTISMWVNWSGEQTDFWGSYGTVLARQTEGPVFTNNLISLTGPDPASAGVAWSSSSASLQPIAGTTPVGDGEWRHIAVTFQPHFTGVCELFLDGVSQGTASLEPFSIDPGTPLTIGAWAGVEAFATAVIDDVSIFDDILSPTQIMELATDVKTPLNVGDGTKPAGLPLRGVVATASTELKADPDLGWPTSWPNRYANNTTDGVGRITPFPDGNVGQIDGMWLSNGDGEYAGDQLPDPDPWIVYDLGETRQLGKLVLYNYNEAGQTVGGVHETDILTSVDGVDYTLLGTYTFDEAPGDDTNPGQIVNLGGLNTRYVKFDIISNFSGIIADFATNPDISPYAGLNEVDFYLGTGVQIPGDANGDQHVNDVDAKILATNWGYGPDASWTMGDFNGDGKVDAADAAILAAHWGTAPTSESTAIPEPGTASLVFLVLVVLGTMSRRRRRQ